MIEMLDKHAAGSVAFHAHGSVSEPPRLHVLILSIHLDLEKPLTTEKPPCAAPILAALRANPECRPGILARDRVVYAERGWLSHGNAKELFCLVRHHTWPGTGFFYGHVLRVPVVPEAEAEFPGGAWAAMIIDSGIAIDGETPDEVLGNAKEWLWNLGNYEPCHAQDEDDVFKLCPGFEEACAALEEMIRRFDTKRRATVIETEEDYLLSCRRELPAPGKLDMRCMNVYGLGAAYLKDPPDESFRPRPQAPAPEWPQPQGESA